MSTSYSHLFIREFTNLLVPEGKTSLVVQSNNKLALQKKNKQYDYIIIINLLEKEKDILALLDLAYQRLKINGRFVAIYKNYLHSFFIGLYQSLTKTGDTNRNWLSTTDIKTFLKLTNFDLLYNQPLCFLGKNIPFISPLLNRFILFFFPFNHLSFLHYTIAVKRVDKIKSASVSIVIPARNEAGNIKKLFTSIEKIGNKCEVIFVEGHSTDHTREEINKYIRRFNGKKGISYRLLLQKGKGKADAVNLGFKKATGDILMIYDADMTVAPTDLPKFYSALTTYRGDFINGSRLIYPIEKNAMQFLNTLGNKCFSLLYTFILGQPIKDTLCGTKALWRKDYLLFSRNSPFPEKQDPFGDLYLLLAASKMNLKIIDLPIRYHDREYGSTNIRRFQNGWQLFRFSLIAIKKLKMRL